MPPLVSPHMRGDGFPSVRLALTHQLAAALAHVTQLEQQLAHQPAPTPTPPEPVDPKATEALAALLELAKALKLVAA